MSEEINISNYEVYAMDYIDGALSVELKTSFDAFLILNPEIADEIDALRDFETLESSSGPSFDKSVLKIDFSGSKNINETNYEELLIRSVEGQLNDVESDEMKSFIASNSVIAKEYSLYQKTILSPDLDIVYSSKSSLRKSIPLWQNTSQIVYRAAAIAVIALGSVTIWNVINEEMYVPRNGIEDYTFIEPMINQKIERDELKSEEVYAQSESAQTENNVKQLSIERSAPLAQISKLNSEISQVKASVNERASIAYQPKVSEWTEEEPVAYASANKTEELNLTQFIGKQFFGLSPDKTPTTMALMKESIVKTIDDRDNVALNTSDDDSDKKTIEFLAGNFGFKRVSYK